MLSRNLLHFLCKDVIISITNQANPDCPFKLKRKNNCPQLVTVGGQLFFSALDVGERCKYH